MTIISTWRRATTALAAICAVGILLSGCVVSSTEPLFSTTETLTDVLPASFEMVTYSETEGVYVASTEDPQAFTFKDGGWVSDDGGMTIYFLDIEDPYNYLMAAVSTDGTLYGATGIDGKGIAAIRMVLDADPSTIAGLPPTAEVADGGIVVETRAELEAVFRLISSGTLPTTPLVAYVGGGTPPARIVADGDWFTAE